MMYSGDLFSHAGGGVFIQVIQHFHCFALHVPAFFVLARFHMCTHHDHGFLSP